MEVMVVIMVVASVKVEGEKEQEVVDYLVEVKEEMGGSADYKNITFYNTYDFHYTHNHKNVLDTLRMGRSNIRGFGYALLHKLRLNYTH